MRIRASLALLFWTGAAGASGHDLGTLFTTTEERQALDDLPHRQAPVEQRIPPLQGVVMRRNGEPMAWFDDQPLSRGDSANGFVLLDAGAEGARIIRRPPLGETPDAREPP